MERRCAFSLSGRRPHEQLWGHAVPARLSTRGPLRVVLFELALPAGHRALDSRTSVLFPRVLAVRARCLPQPTPQGTARSARRIGHETSIAVRGAVVSLIPYRAVRTRS